MSMPSSYLLYHSLADQGFDPIRISRAIDALEGRHDDEDDRAEDHDGPGWDDSSVWELGPGEPEAPEFEPSEDDLADYAEWSAELGRGYPAEYPPSYVTDEDIVTCQGGAG